MGRFSLPPDRARLVKRCIAAAAVAIAAAFILVLAFEFMNVFWRPPQPLPFGTIQWAYETGFTVDAVHRAKTITLASRRLVARGEFYVVDARVVCPFGERYHWSDTAAAVETFGGYGGSRMRATFAPDARAQPLADRSIGRNPLPHEVLGAQERERLVFDLPADVEQPGLVFADANDAWGILDLIFGDVWQPHRFNLRYD